MKLKNFLSVIIPTAIIAIVAVLLSMFWPAITGTIKGESYYTGKDVQNSYDQGYKDGNKNETELNAKLNYYETIVDDYTKSISQLNAEISNLNKYNTDYQTQIKNLEQTKTTNLETIQNLQTVNSNNETTIANLNTQINDLNTQITSLQNSLNNEQTQNQDKANQIVTLKNQVNNLQTLVNQLQSTNELNLNTINQLNNQVKDLNSQISDLKYQSSNNTEIVSNLNAKIADLQKSIAYYEQYIANMESETQVVATFEFDGSVINIQIVNKGSIVSINNPASTDTVIFNGWKVNNTTVDLTTYTVNENTKFVADVTYKYNVKFLVDSATYDTQFVIENNYAILPITPTKTGYEFDGWTIDGSNIVNIAEQQITADTTFTAVFTKLYTVTFMYEDEIKTTISVRNGTYATAPAIENTTYKVFNGWKVNGTAIDLTTYKIVADTTIVADITYKYDVEFMVDDAVYASQIVTAGNFAILPENPSKDGYMFNGWTINGTDIVSVDSYAIGSNTQFIAKFTQSGAIVSYNNEVSAFSDFKDAWDYAVGLNGTSSKHISLKLFADTTSKTKNYDYIRTNGLFDTSAKYIDLDLNGFTITMDGTSDYMFQIEYNSVLTILDSSINQTGTITGYNSGQYLFYVYGATLIINGGNIKDNTTSYGEIFKVQSSDYYKAYLSILGGKISNNLSRYSAQNGVICISDKKTTLTMSGGEISLNSSRAVCMYSGTFNFSDGLISENGLNLKGSGLGVYIGGGTFTMSGGTISKHKITDTNYYGAAIFICSGTAIINGGLITENESVSYGTVTAWNLSDKSSSAPTLTIKGGLITGNKGSAAVRIWKAKYTIADNVVVDNIDGDTEIVDL